MKDYSERVMGFNARWLSKAWPCAIDQKIITVELISAFLVQKDLREKEQQRGGNGENAGLNVSDPQHA